MILTVLSDPGCPLCRWLKGWLTSQPQLVPLAFVDAGSPEANRAYPALDPAATLDDLHVVADDGALYTGDAAYLVVLWALADYRSLANTLSSGPLLRGVARKTLALVSKYRPRDHRGECADGRCPT